MSRSLTLVSVIAGCGQRPATPAIAPARPVATLPAVAERAPVDPIAVLTPVPGADVSWLAPGQAQLELDGALIENPGGGKPIEVAVVDEHGSRVRVALLLEHARFSLWTDRNRLFAVIRKTQRVNARGARAMGDVQATIKAGARVKRIGHKEAWTNIRYFGALEVEGWIPDAVLGEAGPPHEEHGRYPSGYQTVMVMPGAVIRSEAKWAADELAVMANGYFLDSLNELEDDWTEVSYEDGDVSVRGFVSKRLPPGQVHRPHTDPETKPIPITPNTKVASGTCLYSRVKGEAVGYIVGDRDVDLADGELGWFALSIDSPWGPIAFAARGSTRTDLQACAPAGTVPPSRFPRSLRLSPREHRGALRHERGDALAGVVHHDRCGLHVRFRARAGDDLEPEAATDRELRLLHGERRVRGDGLRELHRGGHHVRRGHSAVEDAHALGLRAIDEAAGEQQIRGARHADQARQHVADRHTGCEPELHEVRAVLRLERADPEIADQCEPEAAAHGVAVERTDHRDAQLEQREKRLVHRERLLVRLAIVLPLKRGLEVRTAGEARTGAGDDKCADARIRLRARTRGGEGVE